MVREVRSGVKVLDAHPCGALRSGRLSIPLIGSEVSMDLKPPSGPRPTIAGSPMQPAYYARLDLYCPTLACGDPMPMAQVAPQQPMNPYGPVVMQPVPVDQLPRLRRPMVFLGGNFLRTQFRYTCPVCSFTRLFQRNFWSGEITEIAQAQHPGNAQGP